MFVLAHAGTGLRVGVLAAAFGLGFRHGIDWDHLAAITDITGSQPARRRSFFLATLYALGHGLVVFGLGLTAVLLSRKLPAGVDAVMSRVVGATLVLLGVSVGVGLVRRGREFRLRSRWMMLFQLGRASVRRLRRPRTREVVIVHDHPHSTASAHHHDAHDDAHDEGRRHDVPVAHGHVLGARGSAGPATAVSVHRHAHRHVAAMPDDPFVRYGSVTAFAVGMLHGVGAETPTQLLLFVTAAGVGGKAAGIALLACFVAGLLASNSVVAVAGTLGFTRATRHFPVYATMSVVTAVCSLAIGAVFLTGSAGVLPVISG